MKNSIWSIQGIMSAEWIDAWVLINHGIDTSDPFFKEHISDEDITAYAIITQTKVHLLISPLDKDKVNEEDFDTFTVMSSSGENPSVISAILQEESVWNLALNYSSVGDTSVDTIGYWECSTLMSKLLERIPSLEIISSENIIYGLVDIKSEEDINKLTLAKNRAEEILQEAFKRIKAWMTEYEVSQIVHELFREKPEYFNDKWVVNEEYSWSEEVCPIVLTGENFIKWWHAKPSETIIEKWNTVYFDFGVKLTFSDGTSFSSDIQRMGYVLNDDETQAPDDIQERFDVIFDAISSGIKQFRPWMTWKEADTIVREKIIAYWKSKVQEIWMNNEALNEVAEKWYNHSTGHPIWEDAHWPGVIIWSVHSRNALKLNNNWVYTIEPRIAVKNGVSVEEMVVVTSNWNYVIGERQKELILIW